MSEQTAKGMVTSDLRLEGGRVGFLLLHGLGGTPVEMRYLAQGLARRGFTVHCPLLKGHGGSDLLLNTATWKDWVESGRRAYAELAEICDEVIVCGQSAGGMVSLHIAAELSRQVEQGVVSSKFDRVAVSTAIPLESAAKFKGLVLCSPTFWPNGWAIPSTLQFFRLIQQRWFADLFRFRERAPYGIKDERLRRFVLDSLQQDGRALDDIFGRKGGTVFEFRHLADRAKRKLPHIKVPTLLFHSREDDQADLSNALKVVRGIKGRVDLVVLDDSYHLVTLDRQRSVVLEKTEAFGLQMCGEPRVAKPDESAGLQRADQLAAN